MNDFLSHLKAVLYRNFKWAIRSPFRLTDVFIWPVVMLFTLSFFLSTVGGEQQYIPLLILSVIGWRSLFFVTFETNVSFVEEHWDKSLSDLLASPINTLEIAIGGAITGILKTIVVIFLVLAIGYFIYGFELTEPVTFLVAMCFLMLAGFSIGFTLFGFSCYFEKRNVFTLSFLLPEIVGLLSGPYYSVNEIFPGWLAAILNTFPTTHAFNLIKSIRGFAEADYTMLVVTSLFWLVLAIATNKFFYDHGRRKGTLTKVG